MRILLIGGAGYIGSATACDLLKSGHDVVVLDSFAFETHGPSASSIARAKSGLDVPVIVADAGNPTVLGPLVEAVDVVMLFASLTCTASSMTMPGKFVRTNVGVAASLCDALLALDTKPRRIVLASTRAVHGEGARVCPEHGRIISGPRALSATTTASFEPSCPLCGATTVATSTSESDPTLPVSVYGATKLAQETLLRAVCSSLEIPLTILRYQNVYGLGTKLSLSLRGTIPFFVQQAAGGKPIPIFENGGITRDLIHISDVVEVNRLAVDSAEGGIRTLGIGSGSGVTLEDVAGTVSGMAKRGSPVVLTSQYRIGDVRSAICDNSQLMAFGKTSFVPLAQGLEELLTAVFGSRT